MRVFSIWTGRWQSAPGALLIAWCVMVQLGCVAAAAGATVWRVAQDGSGQFTSIQPAVNAAAPGDTVSIGPGEYTETSTFPLDDFQSAAVHVGVDKEALTLLGDGVDKVIIGPAAQNYASYGIVMRVGHGAGLNASRLSVRNVRQGLRVHDSFQVKALSVKWCGIGAFVVCETGGLIKGCEIANNRDGVLSFSGSRNLTVQSCMFDGQSQVSIDFEGTIGGRVESCSVNGGRVGIQYAQGSTGSVYRTRVTNAQNVALVVTDASSCNVDGSTFESPSSAACVIDFATARGDSNVFLGGDWSALDLGCAPVTFSNSHIIARGSFAVRVLLCVGSPAPIYQDLRGNYWGTADSSAIAALIHDRVDDSQLDSFVLFNPFATGPVPVSAQSFGGLKARFGGGGHE